MPIRRVKQHSDRGRIMDLARPVDVVKSDLEPTPAELRLKNLFEFAQKTNNEKMQASLGIITTDYISDKNALPLSVYRIRQVVDDIKSKSSGAIDQLSQEISGLFGIEETPEAKLYWENKARNNIKTASKKKRPFWRVSKA